VGGLFAVQMHKQTDMSVSQNFNLGK